MVLTLRPTMALADEVETTWIGDNPSPEVAARHLREVVVETARFETGRLVTPEDTAFFGAVRAVMSDMEYVAALYSGWDGKNRRRIQTSAKTIAFMDEVVAAASGNAGYSTWGPHLYELYRCGLIHQRLPKVLRSHAASTQLLGWALMYHQVDQLGPERGNAQIEHLRLHQVDENLALLPVSALALYQDFLAACQRFATLLEAERAAGDAELLTRWHQTWNALGEPEDTPLSW
jgi:hypothetical protein